LVILNGSTLLQQALVGVKGKLMWEDNFPGKLSTSSSRASGQLKALGMSANELAIELGVPTNRLTRIMRGKRGIAGDTALRLGRWFDTGPDIWINLQRNYALRLVTNETGDVRGV
jgi:addiction module HigA family antidote